MTRYSSTAFIALIIGLLRLPCRALEDQQGAFVQTGEELHFFLDAHHWSEGISSRLFGNDNQIVNNDDYSRRQPLSETNSGGNDVGGNESSEFGVLNQLKFEPSLLEFGFQSIGVPEQKKVKVINPTASKVRFDAISGSTVHFHCSFFNDKTVDPGSSTTFDVVFLPRQEGQLRNTLLIHSSLGSFSYTVSGVGTSNPYRLRPFVGARVPLNGTFIGPLEMHNPHSTTLRVVEMYSSGGDLHVDLPTDGGAETSARAAWEIPPFQTKVVGKARFIGSRERNATAYIRIKTDRQEVDGELPMPRALIIPVEVEVTAKPGLYASVDRLDFGTVIGGERSKWSVLEVYNTYNRSLEITSIYLDSDSLLMDFRPNVVLHPNTRTPTYVAKFAFQAEGGDSGRRQRTGRLVLNTAGGQYALPVPYMVQLLEGRLTHEVDDVAFYSGCKEPVDRNITLWNRFDTPVAVYNVSLPKNMRKIFTIKSFTTPVIIPPKSSRVAVTLSYNETESTNAGYAMIESRFRLLTNITHFDIPLYLFDGKLRYSLYSIDQQSFDFGIVEPSQERFILFAVTNENPIPVTIIDMSNVLVAYTRLELLGMEAGNHSVLSYDHSPSDYRWKPGENFTIDARSFAVFRLTVVAPNILATYQGSLIFKTAFQTTELPVTFSVEEGSITSVPDVVSFNDAFPGKISSHNLRLFSTFSHNMPVLRLSTLSNDPRFFFESFDKDNSPLIKHGEVSQVGRIFFMPVATCLDDCYVGLPLHTEDGQHWIRGMRLPPELPEIDAYLYRKLRSKWDTIVARGEHVVNSTIIVDSTEVKSFAISAQGKLAWPRLIKDSAVHFPLTAVGNYTIVNISLQNPSNLPVAVQLLPLTIYPGPYDLIKLLNSDIPAPLTSYVEVDDVLIFSLRDSELYNARPESPVPQLRQTLEKIVGIQIPRFTLSLLLQPSMKVRVRVGFMPPDYQLRSSLLLIRNNLTVLETVTLYGRGGKLELRIGNRLANSNQPLLFEIRENHLKECDNIRSNAFVRLQHKLPTSLTVRRSFVARNTGELPLHIGNISISNHQCQNLGFRVLNCESFRLEPNETHVIEMAFTPDFTMKWYDALLQLHVAGAAVPLSYPVGVSLPTEWLPKCQGALPRPYWEPLMYYISVATLVCLLTCVVASAYLEGDRIVMSALRRQQLRAVGLLGTDARAPFNLNVMENTEAYENSKNQKNEAETKSKTTKLESTGERTKPLLWRLILLFYHLLTKRRVSSSASKNSTGGDTAPSTPTAQIVVSARVVRTTAPNLTKNAHQEVASTSPTGDLKHRQNAQVPTSSRRTSDGNVAIVRPSPSRTPPRALISPTPSSKKQTVTTKTNKKAKSSASESEQKPPLEKKESTGSMHKSESKSPSNNNHQVQRNKPADNVRSAEEPVIDQHPRGRASKEPESSLLEPQDTRIDGIPRDVTSKNDMIVVVRRTSRSRSSREVSESDPDERSMGRSLYLPKTINSLRDRSPKLRPTPQSSVRSEIVTTSAPTADRPPISKPDNRRTAADINTNRKNVKNLVPDSFTNDEDGCKTAKSAGIASPWTSRANDLPSESDESNMPEWDQTNAASEKNFDEEFAQLATQTENFAANNDLLNHQFRETGTGVGSTRLGSRISGGNESMLSSTSRSGSSSSLDASSSSSSSTEDRKADGLKSLASGTSLSSNSAATSTKHRKKKTVLSAAGSGSPRHQRQQQLQDSASSSTGSQSMANVPVPPGFRPPLPHQQSQRQLLQRQLELQQSQKKAETSVNSSQQPAAGRRQQNVDTTKTIMQQLREERLRRLQEYRLQKIRGDEWPGFDLPPVNESLWDDDHDPWRASPHNAAAAEIWNGPNWMAGGLTEASSSRPSSVNPFPSLFDFSAGADGRNNDGWRSFLNSNNSEQTTNEVVGNDSTLFSGTQMAAGGLRPSTASPETVNVAAWDPAIVSHGNSTTVTGHGQQGEQAENSTWNYGSVMTGVDLGWTQSLMKDKNDKRY